MATPPQVPPTAADELAALRLSEPKDLWKRFSNGPDAFNALLASINDARGRRGQDPLSAADFAKAVAEHIRNDKIAQDARPSRLKNALIVALVLAFAVATWWRQLIPVPQRSQVAIATPGGIPAYRVITVDDVLLAAGWPEVGAVTDLGDVVGRYALAQLPAGRVVRRDELSKGQLVPGRNRTILTLPVRQVNSAVAGPLPAMVTLVLSHKTDSKRSTRVDVALLLVAGEAGAASATVGADAASLSILESLLPNVDITVVSARPRS